MGNLTESKNIPELRFPGFTGEWEEKKLGEILEFKNGLNKGKEYFGYGTPIVNYMDVNRNKLLERKDIEGLVNVNKSELDRFKVIKGDVFFTRTSETIEEIGLASVIIEDIDNCVYSGFVLRGRNITNNMDNKFSGYFYNTERIRKEIMRKSSKTTRALTNGAVLSEVKAIIPTKKEQEKIGSFFFSLDKKLEFQKAKIEELRAYKKGMMQRIFSQEIRFKDENGQDYHDWEEKKLGEVFEESTLKLKDIKERKRYAELLSVTLYEGIKKQTELGDSDTSSIDKSNYKIVNKNDIVYNSMRMWQGASGISHYDGIVSSAYVVLRPKKIIRSDFMARYFKDLKSIHKFYERSQGMTSDTLTLRYNLFKDILLTIPSLPEQEKIAYFLSALDRRIELEEERLEAYEEFKKGLMQRMFV